MDPALAQAAIIAMIATAERTSREFLLVEELASQRDRHVASRPSTDNESFYILEGEITFYPPPPFVGWYAYERRRGFRSPPPSSPPLLSSYRIFRLGNVSPAQSNSVLIPSWSIILAL